MTKQDFIAEHSKNFPNDAIVVMKIHQLNQFADFIESVASEAKKSFKEVWDSVTNNPAAKTQVTKSFPYISGIFN